MPKSVFTKMVEGEMPCDKIYEDEQTMAFLDFNPLTKGHTLVIPKDEIDHLDECPADLYQKIFETVQKISIHLKEKLGAKRIALVVHGFDVPHAHVHVIPLYTGKELRLANREDPNPDYKSLAELAKELALY